LRNNLFEASPTKNGREVSVSSPQSPRRKRMRRIIKAFSSKYE
jgi:hypothetical protein